MANMVSRKPRVVIVGAGMAGLSAAHQLQQVDTSSLDLIVLEASNRIGGRICTSEIGGDNVELGATWIHGIEGSPVYKIAQSIGALESEKPFERQDGFPQEPIVKAEGGLIVDTSIVNSVMALYKKLLAQIRAKEKLEGSQHAQSIGAFVNQGFNAFFSQQDNASQISEGSNLFDYFSNDGLLSWPNYCSPWTLRSLQEALLSMNEYMERVATSANSLHDLDLQAEKEYTDYPGEHITIGKGYITILNELASSLPASALHLGKKVDKFIWNRSIQSCSPPVVMHCSDGSVYEADHVIITVSLGVLKAGIKHDEAYPWANPEGRPVCRSLNDLQAGLAIEEAKTSSLFEPPLPPCKQEAISRLGYGVVDKLFLQLNSTSLSSTQLQQLNSHIQLLYKNYDGLGNESIPWWMRKTFSMAPIYNGSSVLLCWFAGGEALELEALSDEEIMSGVARTLAEFGVAGRNLGLERIRSKAGHNDSSSGSDSEDSVSRGGSSSSSSSSSRSNSDSEDNYDDDDGDVCKSDSDFCTMFSGVLRSKWGRNPLFHGSYSFVATGASGEDIEKLAQPLPINANVNAISGRNAGDYEEKAPLQLLFAGEATERNFYSTTHGAHLSGLREANRLLHHYGLSHVAPLRLNLENPPLLTTIPLL